MIILIIGTVAAILLVLLMLLGHGYSDMLDGLEGDAFPLKSIYVAGIAFQRVKLLRLKGNVEKNLKTYNSLYYGRKYSEFYTMINWAQTVSMALLSIAIGFLIAALIPDLAFLLCLAGVVVAVFFSYYFLTYAKQKVDSRQEECEYEFPNAISKMALLVNSGVILHDAWRMVAYGKEGPFYKMMQDACTQMENGVSDTVAFRNFGTQSNSSDIIKFSTALIQSMEHGGGELSIFLANQSSELWNHRRQLSLQRGEKAASALLAPIGLMFGGIMLLVIVSVMQSFSL